ncbi:hypothetical protein FB451DRAFT_1256511 [Mycena latifolia]|nr:hypothetical protein FB451DRAFT_1256511 [Mycena latifolia]
MRGLRMRPKIYRSEGLWLWYGAVKLVLAGLDHLLEVLKDLEVTRRRLGAANLGLDGHEGVRGWCARWSTVGG